MVIRILASLVVAASLLIHAPAIAQRYPAEVVKIVVPFTSGSATDVLARVVAHELELSTGGTFIIDNRPGALGMVGAASVARAAPNGYTLLLSSTSTQSAAPFLFKSLPYDALTGFEHISRLTFFQWLVVSDPALGYNSVQDLVKDARARPDKLFFAYGNASSQVAVAALNKLLGIKTVGVPYKAQPLALNDIAGHRVGYMVVDYTAAGPMLKSGQVKALAIAATKRSPLIPDLPTLEETGLPSYEFVGWAGLAAPAGTPKQVVEYLSQHIQAAMAQPQVVAKLANMGIDAAPLPSGQFRNFIVSQFESWKIRVPDAGLVPQ